ncbi:hypothetical protein LCGC14_0267840 [marine sediment metagenome]|uniref:Uncharacterized protein n=1 Tax=marine sediment metagenome TaxID=412755 RepID=A0A0F9X4X5_9ZZZZ
MVKYKFEFKEDDIVIQIFTEEDSEENAFASVEGVLESNWGIKYMLETFEVSVVE